MSSQLATKPQNKAAIIRQSLESSKPQIAAALPSHLKADRIIRQTMTVVQENETLLACNPLSILKGVIKGSELGLEFGAALGQAWLVPFGGQASLIIGYRGLLNLAMRSGMVQSIQPRVVNAGDRFEVRMGSNARILHEPDLNGAGEPTHYYVVIEFANGGKDFEVMSRRQVESHRDRYSKGASRSDSPWKTAFDQMALKTVIRRLAKRLPMSVEFQNAASLDEAGDAGQLVTADVAIDLEQTPTNRVAGMLADKANGNGHADWPETLLPDDVTANHEENLDSEPPQPPKAEHLAASLKSAATAKDLDNAYREVQRAKNTLTDEQSAALSKAYLERKKQLAGS